LREGKRGCTKRPKQEYLRLLKRGFIERNEGGFQMSQYQKAQSLNASADDGYKILLDVLKGMDMTIQSRDDGARRIRGHWGKKMSARFTFEAVCIPLDEKTAEIKLLYDSRWTSVWLRSTSAMGMEVPAEVEAMFDKMLIEIGRATGLPDTEIDALQTQAQPKAAALPDIKSELRRWGIGMIAIGAISIFVSQLLDPVWGVGLIVLGLINLIVAHRGMFIANGIVLILAGTMNILSTLVDGFSIFFAFGLLQITWGVQEILKFKKYKNAAPKRRREEKVQ
jgi:hypothetical protein